MVSREAEAFIEERERWWAANPAAPKDLTLDNIGEYRRQHRDDYADSCERALEATGVTTTERYIGGTKSLEISGDEGGQGAILYFFGGAFVAGGPEEDVAITAPLVDNLGIPAYAPYYPLSPEHVFPDALNAGVAAYNGLIDQYPASRIAVVGESAGGNLAITVTHEAARRGLSPPGCVVAISPAADLALTGHTSTLDLDPTMKPAERWDLVMHPYLGSAGVEDPLISPLYADYSPGFPSTLITTGTRDFLLSDCARLHHVMRQSGVDVVINVWEGMWHVFEHFYGIPEAADSLAEIAGFIGRRLRIPAR